MNHQTFLEEYNLLNKEQKQAVDTIDGPVFVMAGPGTGKTQILTLRIANILKESPGITPENILALTFTNTAAFNMRERLSAFVGGEIAHRVAISTFHSFAQEMIHAHTDFFPEFVGARLVGDIERIEVMEGILDRIETEFFSSFTRRESTVKDILWSIDKIKQEGWSPEVFEQKVLDQFERSLRDEELFYKVSRGGFKKGDIKPTEILKREKRKDKNLEIKKLYEEYQRIMVEKGMYDFADSILSFVIGLQTKDELRMELEEQFQYILVDEHQDTNDAQNAIIHALISNPVHEGKPNLFVVGDDKQAIFRFAGASKESFGALKNMLSEMTIITLATNYRSGQHILDSSHALISKSADHAGVAGLSSFFTERTGALEYREFSTYKAELLFLAQQVRKDIEQGIPLEEIAVLFRENKAVEDVRMIFDREGIPYRDFSKINLIQDIDTRKLFSLLQSVEDVFSDETLVKILYIDFLKIDVFFVQRLLVARGNSRGDKKFLISLLQDQKKIKELGASQETVDAIARLVKFLWDAKQKSENEELSAYFSWFVAESGYLAYLLQRPNSVLALSKLEKIFDEIKKETASRGSFTVRDFLYYISSLEKHNLSISIGAGNQKGVSLMTYHGAKGLEFDSVYMIKSLAKRGQPKTVDLPTENFSDGSMDDERRLFYVALTRAKKNLYISSYIVGIDGKEKNKSPFIMDVGGLSSVDTTPFEESSTLGFASFFAPVKPQLLSITDQSYITELFLKNKLSVSAINNYVDSPLHYFFRNLLRLPEARTPHLDLGNLVHGTLEKYFNQCIEKQEILDKDSLKESFEIVLSKNPSYRPYEKKGWGILDAYFDDKHTTFEIPLENERRIEHLPYTLRDGQVITLSGAIDKITRDEDGNITVWDYKTGKGYSEKDKPQREKIKRQAVFYKLLLREAFGGRYNFKKAIFEFVQKNKKGEYERMEFEITESDLDEVRDLIQALADDVLGGELLHRRYEKNDKTKKYIDILELVTGEVTQQSLFEEGE